MADTWYAVFDRSGTLISTGTVVADNETLAAQGYHAVQLSVDPTGLVWNSSEQNFTAPPMSPMITSLAFIKRFTISEYQSIYASTDPSVALFRLELDHAPGGMVDLSNPDVQSGVQYLASKGLLTADRASAIVTP